MELTFDLVSVVLFVAAAFLLGLLIGSAIYSRKLLKFRNIGLLTINDSGEEMTIDGLEFFIPLEDFPRNDYVSIKVQTNGGK